MTCVKIRPGEALALANERGHHRLCGISFGDAIALLRRGPRVRWHLQILWLSIQNSCIPAFLIA
jgi:hypothetical protein